MIGEQMIPDASTFSANVQECGVFAAAPTFAELHRRRRARAGGDR
jgi:hypothetical protein